MQFAPGGQTWREETREAREAFHEKLRTEREKFLAELRAKKEEWKNATDVRKRAFCGVATDIVKRRFGVATGALEAIQARVESAIEKLTDEGKDTSAAEEALDVSEAKLAEAKEKAEDIKALIPEGGCKNITPELFEQIKTLAREAKDLLKESKESLREAIQALKDLRGKTDEDESQ